MNTVARPVLAELGNRTTLTTRHRAGTYGVGKFDDWSQAPSNAPTTYAYDANGNQTGAGATTSAYDLADRLVSATVGTTTETYTWSGDGLRRSAATGSQAVKTVRFLVDRTLGQGSVAIERDGADKTLRRYVYGLDLLSQTTPTKGPYWYHHDGLGSVTDITGATGTSLAWTEYQPYGLVRAAAATSQAPSNPFRFTGEYRDPTTGLDHLRARQYDPGTGRFTATDPVSPGVGDPYVSAYAYVNGNPVRYTDPSGRCPWCVIGAAIGFIAYTGSVAVTNYVQGDGLTLEGWNGADAVISTVSGALSGGLSATGLTIGRQVAINAIIGFDSSLVSMVAGGRNDPAELVIGTVVGAAGPRLPGGFGASGAMRGVFSSTAANTGQNLLNNWSWPWASASGSSGMSAK